jgi:tRNA-Thr(GGU) m(6)t(6)A37 methyltransferase TsaA
VKPTSEARLALAFRKGCFVPIGTIQRQEKTQVVKVVPEVRKALLGLKGFSHAWFLYWFHENDDPSSRSILRVHPCRDPANPLTGVFATRSPVRPNLVGMDLCRILKVRPKAGEIVITGCEAREGTPLIDIKPYLPHSDVPTGLRLPAWARKIGKSRASGVRRSISNRMG